MFDRDIPEEIDGFKLQLVDYCDKTCADPSKHPRQSVKLLDARAVHPVVTHEIANADDTAWDALWAFQFGEYGDTRVLIWAGSFEDALEEAAQYLKERGRGGLFTEPEYDTARKEWIEENGREPSTDEEEEAIRDNAEADLIYTESGWIASHEWWGGEAEDAITAACTKLRALLTAENKEV